MTTSYITRTYWTKKAKEWAEGRLSMPQAEEFIAVIDKIMAENERLKEQERCDLCEEPATYHLCQAHMDEMRFMDTLSTDDGEYPQGNEMVLWQDSSGDVCVGGYDEKNGGWFGPDDTARWYSFDQPKVVIWCPLPDLLTMYHAGHLKGGEE